MKTTKHARKDSKQDAASKPKTKAYKTPEEIPTEHVTQGGRLCRIRVRGEKWQADFGEVNGKRLRKSFAVKRDRYPFNRTQAEDWLREQALLLKNDGQRAFSLSEKQRLDAAQAIRALKAAPGATLLSAAEYFVKYCAPGTEAKQVTISDLAEEYYKDGERHGLRQTSLQDIDKVMRKLVAAHGKKLVSQFSRQQAKQFISGLDTLSARSKRHFQTVAGGAFNFAIDNEYTENNPFQRRGGRLHKQDQTMPECLTWTEAQALLRAAEKHYQSMVPALAVAFFTGLRRSELQRLKWENIDLAAGHLQVTPEMAKNRSVRYVTLSANLIKWLTPYRQESGLVAPEGEAYRFRLDGVRRKSKIGRWPHNALRHTYASFHLAMHGDDRLTASEMGHHTDTSMLYKHYRALVPKEDAEKFWQIVPDSNSNTIAFSKAG